MNIKQTPEALCAFAQTKLFFSSLHALIFLLLMLGLTLSVQSVCVGRWQNNM